MMFDTHAHYYDRAFDADRDALLTSLPSKGVELVVCPGCDLETSQACIDLAQTYDHIYAAAGMHPSDLKGFQMADMDKVKTLCQKPKVVAVGEVGLDYYWVKDKEERAFSREVFDAHICLSEELNLPVIVHNRDANKDVMDIVRGHPNARGVFHCYAGSLEDARELVKWGWSISVTGNITFKNARRAPEILTWLPIEHLMLETDAPYMSPEPFRGKRCDSTLITYMAEKIAEWKGLSPEEVIAITTANGKRFFGLGGA